MKSGSGYQSFSAGNHRATPGFPLYNFFLTPVMQVPNTEQDWLIPMEFSSLHQSNGWEAYIIKPPLNSGSLYFNYKHSFSIVLLAVVDTNVKFLYVDIRCNGGISEGGAFLKQFIVSSTRERHSKHPIPRFPFRRKFHCPTQL